MAFFRIKGLPPGAHPKLSAHFGTSFGINLAFPSGSSLSMWQSITLQVDEVPVIHNIVAARNLFPPLTCIPEMFFNHRHRSSYPFLWR